jgi:hypothetical protein
MTRIVVWALLALLVAVPHASAQQRPLKTEDPETIGAGRILLEGGIDYLRSQQYPASGLEGHLWRFPTLGVSVGISSIAELQVDGGLISRLGVTEQRVAPLSGLLDIEGDTTSDIQDLVVGAKVRVKAESYRGPSVALRVATKLPNASNESGLGLDTIDFFASGIVGKTIQSIRLVGNVGVGILSDPTLGHRSNDVLTYGVSIARAVTDRAEVVGELYGRVSTSNGTALPGTETSGILNLGARYTTGSFRLDGAVLVGLNPTDPTYGLTGGFTYVFNAFEVP